MATSRSSVFENAFRKAKNPTYKEKAAAFIQEITPKKAKIAPDPITGLVFIKRNVQPGFKKVPGSKPLMFSVNNEVTGMFRSLTMGRRVAC